MLYQKRIYCPGHALCTFYENRCKTTGVTVKWKISTCGMQNRNFEKLLFKLCKIVFQRCAWHFMTLFISKNPCFAITNTYIYATGNQLRIAYIYSTWYSEYFPFNNIIIKRNRVFMKWWSPRQILIHVQHVSNSLSTLANKWDWDIGHLVAVDSTSWSTSPSKHKIFYNIYTTSSQHLWRWSKIA